MKQIVAIISLVIFSLHASAQYNAAHARISVITCGPGQDLYSLFGHTAIRVIDSSAHTDIVYNWGGFTFDQPNFYLKFMRGKLLYYSSADNYNDFMYEYVYEHRSVYEQVLNIDSASKQKIIDAINFNMQGDNKFYKYDFLLDNCTTRVKNIVFENNKDAVIPDSIVPAKTTSRDLIHYYLERGDQPWSELGIDILLGSRLDWVVTNNDAMFLPEFLMKGLDEAKKENTAFTSPAQLILHGDQPQDASNKNVPLIVFFVFSAIIFLTSRLKSPVAKKLTVFFDNLLLYITGLLGVLLLFMWFGTDHTVCQNNFNLVWAMPLNLPVAFCMMKKPKWLSNYFFIVAVITAIFIATWFWLPQQMNIALLPLVLLLLNRYIVLANKLRRPV